MSTLAGNNPRNWPWKATQPEPSARCVAMHPDRHRVCVYTYVCMASANPYTRTVATYTERCTGPPHMWQHGSIKTPPVRMAASLMSYGVGSRMSMSQPMSMAGVRRRLSYILASRLSLTCCSAPVWGVATYPNACMTMRVWMQDLTELHPTLWHHIRADRTWYPNSVSPASSTTASPSPPASNSSTTSSTPRALQDVMTRATTTSGSYVLRFTEQCTVYSTVWCSLSPPNTEIQAFRDLWVERSRASTACANSWTTATLCTMSCNTRS